MKKTSSTSKAKPADDFDFDFDFGSDMAEFDIDESNDADDVLENPSKELTDEIRAFRQKAKEFDATNEHETYVVVCFSTKADKNRFLDATNLSDKHTLIDGYELARNLNIEPQKPQFKLRKPF